MTRLWMPLYWKKSAHMHSKGYAGGTGGDGGVLGWEGAMRLQW